MFVKGLEETVSVESTWRVDRLRALRQQQGLSQRELARRCGLAMSMIAKYERGYNDPSVVALRSLAEELNVSADYLLGSTDDPRRSDADQISDDERAMLDAFRTEGWRGVMRLGIERIP